MFITKGVHSEQTESFFYDDFNYSANPATQKSELWQTLNGTPAASGAYYFSAARSTMATVGETVSDYIRVQGTITLNGTGRSSLMLFSTDAPFTSPVAFLEVRTGTTTLGFYSQTSLTAVGTARGTNFSYTAVAGDVITAEYNPADSTFRGYVNSVQRATWVNGSGATITVGKGRRHHGLNSNMDNSSGVRWDSVQIYDAKPASIILVAEGPGSRATGSSATLATSHSLNVTETSINHMLIVSVVSSTGSNIADSGATVTYNGVAMTLISSQHLGSSTARAWQGTYYLFNPPTGNNTVQVTSTGTAVKTVVACQSLLYKGVRTLANVGAATSLGVIITGDIRQDVFILCASNNTAMSTISSPARMSYTAGSAVATGVGDYIGVADLRSVGQTTTATFGGTVGTPGVIVTQLIPA